MEFLPDKEIWGNFNGIDAFRSKLVMGPKTVGKAGAVGGKKLAGSLKVRGLSCEFPGQCGEQSPAAILQLCST